MINEQWDQFDACLKCNLCVSQCPVMTVNADFPGPKALGPEWFRRTHQQDAMAHVDDCTFCQVCESVCPVDVPIAHLIADHKAHQTRTFRRRTRDGLLARPHWIGRVAWVGDVPKVVRHAVGLSESVRFPRRHHRETQSLGGPLGVSRGRVGVFSDCYTAAYDPALRDETAALLSVWGWTVVTLPSQGSCCGAAAYAAGNADLARRNGQHQRDRLAKVLPGLDLIVTLNATCDGTLRDEWPRYYGLSLEVPVLPFDEVAESAPQEFWDRLRTVSDDTVLLTHTTCRGKVSRGDGQLHALAERAGYRGVVPCEALCCGAAGSYAFKAEHEATAGRLGQNLSREIAEAGATGVMTDSGTCALHIEQDSGVKTGHPAHWLYRRYGAYLAQTHATAPTAIQDALL